MKPFLTFEFTETDPITEAVTVKQVKLLMVLNETRILIFEDVCDCSDRFEMDFETFNNTYLQSSKIKIL